MKTYLAEQLTVFLEAIDSALHEPAELVVIGGTAAALHHGVKHPTRDIDTWNAITRSLATAIDSARRKTGLEIPVAKSGVAGAPEGMEERLERVLAHLERLRVLVPEKHDLALMKMLRANQHDLDVIAEMHSHSSFDLDVLVDRYENEMDPVGDPRTIRANFLALVEVLFPEKVDSVVEKLRPREL